LGSRVCRNFFSASMYLAWIVFFVILSASLAEGVAQPSTNVKVDQDGLVFIGTFPFRSRNLTIRNLNSEEPAVHVSLDKTDLLRNDSDKMIKQGQIVFGSQNVQDFSDFQIPAGGKVVISVSIVANPVFPSDPGTYNGKILIIIPNSTELTVPIIVDLKYSGIQGALSEGWDSLLKASGGIATVLSIAGLLTLFYGGGTLYLSWKSDKAKRRTEEEERVEKNKDKLNTDLKYQIVKAVNGKGGFIVIRPSIENVGTNIVTFDLTEPDQPKISPKYSPASDGDFTKLSIESYDPQSLSFVKETKTNNQTITQSVDHINWFGKDATGNESLSKSEKTPPNEKLVKFNGEGIFVVKLVIVNKVKNKVLPVSVQEGKVVMLKERVATLLQRRKVKALPKEPIETWPATAYGTTVEAKEKVA
jgi:hypothetical protein